MSSQANKKKGYSVRSVVTLSHLAWDKEFYSPCVYQIFGKMSVISFCSLRAQMSPERTDKFSGDNLSGKDSSTEI